MKWSVLLALFLLGCDTEKSLDGKKILSQAVSAHDPEGHWNSAQLNLHIQEPRVSNPYRYSIIKLNNLNNTFELSRNRGQSVSTHIIDNAGNSSILLDGNEDIDSALIAKYKLDASGNIRYQNFYQLMYGLPMSLGQSLEKVDKTTLVSFNGTECYKVEMELNQEMISKHWNIFISLADKELKGIEIVFPDKPNEGERLLFEGTISVAGMKIPRIRHWYKLKDNTYSGSDLIIKEQLE